MFVMLCAALLISMLGAVVYALVRSWRTDVAPRRETAWAYWSWFFTGGLSAGVTTAAALVMRRTGMRPSGGVLALLVLFSAAGVLALVQVLIKGSQLLLNDLGAGGQFLALCSAAGSMVGILFILTGLVIAFHRSRYPQDFAEALGHLVKGFFYWVAGLVPGLAAGVLLVPTLQAMTMQSEPSNSNVFWLNVALAVLVPLAALTTYHGTRFSLYLTTMAWRRNEADNTLE